MGLFNRTKEEPDQTLPRTDAERWIAGTCAIWSEYCGGSCRYFGGYEKTKANAKMLKKVLWQDWAVKDHENGVEMVQYLLDNAGPGEEGAADGGSNISERAPFEEAYQQVKASAASPLSLDWNLNLE